MILNDGKRRPDTGRGVWRHFSLFVMAVWVVLNGVSLPAYLSSGTAPLASPFTVPVGILLPFGGQALPDGFFALTYKLLWPVMAVLAWKLSSGDWRARSGPYGLAIATVLTLASIVSVNVVENTAALGVSPIAALIGILPLCLSVAFTFVVTGLAATLLGSWLYAVLQWMAVRSTRAG